MLHLFLGRQLRESRFYFPFPSLFLFLLFHGDGIMVWLICAHLLVFVVGVPVCMVLSGHAFSVLLCDEFDGMQHV
jgi:hypothetical protein